MVYLVATPLTVFATNGDHLLGISAKQWGMAGAVVAAPQDAATIAINPAGLSELDIDKVWFDISPGFINPPREINGTKSDSNLFFVPSGSLAVKVNQKLYLGFGLSAQAGLGVDVSDALPAPGNQPIITSKGLFKITPGIAYKFDDKLSLGMTLNIAYQSVALRNPAFTFSQNQQFGFGITLGTIYHISDSIQLGAAWASKTNINSHEFNTSAGKYSMDIDAPQTMTIGVAFKPKAGWLLEADIKWINFSDTFDSVSINGPAAPGMPSAINPGWDDQVVYGLGVQKELNADTTVRAGINYGASPIKNNDVDNNLGSLAITELHLAVGASRRFNANFTASIAYTHAFNNELVSDSGSGNKIEAEQNIVYMQITYKD